MTTKKTEHHKPDMSSKAIDRRLREVAQLYKLGIAIEGAHRLGKVKDLRGEKNN